MLELENRSEEEAPPTRQTHLMGLIQPEMNDVRPPRGWLERWWSPDPRKAPREHAPGLAAYYWTGGPPEAHRSKTSVLPDLYVVTEERWYPGTLVLMTLQNSGLAKRSRSAPSAFTPGRSAGAKTVSACSLCLQKDPDDPAMAAADRKALDQFLQRLRKSRN